MPRSDRPSAFAPKGSGRASINLQRESASKLTQTLNTAHRVIQNAQSGPTPLFAGHRLETPSNSRTSGIMACDNTIAPNKTSRQTPGRGTSPPPPLSWNRPFVPQVTRFPICDESLRVISQPLCHLGLTWLQVELSQTGHPAS